MSPTVLFRTVLFWEKIEVRICGPMQFYKKQKFQKQFKVCFYFSKKGVQINHKWTKKILKKHSHTDFFSSFGPKDISILIFSCSMILLSIAIFLALENDAVNRRTRDNINLFDNETILLSDDYARKCLCYFSDLRMILNPSAGFQITKASHLIVFQTKNCRKPLLLQ